MLFEPADVIRQLEVRLLVVFMSACMKQRWHSKLQQWRWRWSGGKVSLLRLTVSARHNTADPMNLVSFNRSINATSINVDTAATLQQHVDDMTHSLPLSSGIHSIVYSNFSMYVNPTFPSMPAGHILSTYWRTVFTLRCTSSTNRNKNKTE